MKDKSEFNEEDLEYLIEDWHWSKTHLPRSVSDFPVP